MTNKLAKHKLHIIYWGFDGISFTSFTAMKIY
jgi:hypothetical protein